MARSGLRWFAAGVVTASWGWLASNTAARAAGPDVAAYGWSKLYDGGGTGWTGRAGLQAVQLRNRLFVMGGRTPTPVPTNPFGSKLWNDVWSSPDLGRTWTRTAEVAPWSARGYFQAVTLGGAMFVIGGQDFSAKLNPACTFGPSGPACPPGQAPGLPDSRFFGDVWRSRDGVTWREMTADAPWERRSGHSAIVFKGWIYVLGGGNGDDAAIGGSGRKVFNDVWRSRDGARWELVAANAPWRPRAGAAVVEHRGQLYLIGGEDGFLCTTGADGLRCPYFNDVWRTRDGRTWEEVTPAAGMSPRPGHQCQSLADRIVCFGGFGWPAPADPAQPGSPPFVATHPADVWTSPDGAAWTKVSDRPWNAASSADVKYDFDSLVVTGGRGGPAVFTFGGDREVSFAAPDASLVDDEVWRFGSSP
jgi:hypothetical protein